MVVQQNRYVNRNNFVNTAITPHEHICGKQTAKLGCFYGST